MGEIPSLPTFRVKLLVRVCHSHVSQYSHVRRSVPNTFGPNPG